jgi:hypothetical protein
MRRKKPKEKTFSLHWGSGVVEEEVRIATPYHLPTIQLLKFTAGPAAGSRALRFCHYDARGRFQRSPLIVDEKDIDTLAKALAKSKRLHTILARLGTATGTVTPARRSRQAMPRPGHGGC